MPKTRSSDAGSQPISGSVCSQPRIPLHMAISARNAISMPPILSARCNPSPAPCAAASIKLTAVFSTLISTRPAVAGFPVSGMKILASMMVAGAVMMTAVSR